ncbi:alpha/beta hydrolase [Haloplasma contractile]|uniref:Lipase protein n=1 Tax=Haloplasma contractile SSD-17B TaxID=1033810 RepID=U2E7Q1_9MOLU|nr:alpha/beta hydrolase [Haloplasma contractile]ERJ10926.1 lipase protein [Haloplasma contractile SSD-17B]
MNINKLKEYISVPFLIANVIKSNFIGKRKFDANTYYYGDHKHQNIILIKPKQLNQKKKTIFFCHGGGWRHGNSKAFRFVGYYFASMGYTTIVADYRKLPKSTYPIQVEDTANALRTGIEKVREQGLNDEVILVGHSAGAQLVALLGYSDLLKKVKFDKSLIKGVISISGPLNFSECKNNYINKVISSFVVNDCNKQKADPFRYINENARIPVLCIHGDCDPSVELASQESFVNRINQIENGLGKIFIIRGGLHSNLAKLFFRKMKEHEYMIEWIKSRDRLN